MCFYEQRYTHSLTLTPTHVTNYIFFLNSTLFTIISRVMLFFAVVVVGGGFGGSHNVETPIITILQSTPLMCRHSHFLSANYCLAPTCVFIVANIPTYHIQQIIVFFFFCDKYMYNQLRFQRITSFFWLLPRLKKNIYLVVVNIKSHCVCALVLYIHMCFFMCVDLLMLRL